MSAVWVREKLHALCFEAERELSWKDLAVFIDDLDEEYQYFCSLTRMRRIGPGIPKSRRPAFARSVSVGEGEREQTETVGDQ